MNERVGSRTVAEELVLLPIPHQDDRTLAQAFILLRLTCTPVIPPVLLHYVQRGLQGLREEVVGQAIISTIVQLNHPCRRRRYVLILIFTSSQNNNIHARLVTVTNGLLSGKLTG